MTLIPQDKALLSFEVGLFCVVFPSEDLLVDIARREGLNLGPNQKMQEPRMHPCLCTENTLQGGPFRMDLYGFTVVVASFNSLLLVNTSRTPPRRRLKGKG